MELLLFRVREARPGRFSGYVAIVEFSKAPNFANFANLPTSITRRSIAIADSFSTTSSLSLSLCLTRKASTLRFNARIRGGTCHSMRRKRDVKVVNVLPCLDSQLRWKKLTRFDKFRAYSHSLPLSPLHGPARTLYSLVSLPSRVFSPRVCVNLPVGHRDQYFLYETTLERYFVFRALCT